MKTLNRFGLSTGVFAIAVLSGISSTHAQNNISFTPTAVQPSESPFVITETDNTYIVRILLLPLIMVVFRDMKLPVLKQMVKKNLILEARRPSNTPIV